jgi:DNA topoisomerase I
MGKTLVIVESPAKAKTINKYLGKDFVVKSSVGHVRDLPTASVAKDDKDKLSPAEVRKLPPEEKAVYKAKQAKKALVHRMGIDPENGWHPNYQILPNKEKVIKELKSLAKNADEIYLATDLDREGEAIAWHLREIIGGKNDKYKRVVFNEITKSAIQDAFAEPGELDMNFVNAQQARRFLDRVVGFMVSPLLWKKVARGLSAGRVQSVAVRLVVDKEREIRAFNPEEFWEIFAETKTATKDELRLTVAKYLGTNFRPDNGADAQKAYDLLNQQDYIVAKREDKPSRSKPSAPFITSTLQQAASTRLGYGVKKTMMMAQRLYEGGHITYMRTDSTNLSADAVANCRDYIQSEFGPRYLPDEAMNYSSKKGAQEAHEAIRPTSVAVKSGHLEDMEADAKKLYELIWRQFVACQMTPAEYDATSITVKSGDFDLKTRGRVLRFDGWTRVQPAAKKKDDDVELPNVKIGDKLNLTVLEKKQNFTKPPARFTEASLVKELEKRGIGRPSTYASIISTIQDRGYVGLHNRRFYAEKMGEIVTDRLMGSFRDLVGYNFTREMEEELDAIADGRIKWKKALDNFYGDFSKTLKLAEADSAEGGMKENKAVETDIPCTACQRPMSIRVASTGVFLGCTGFNLPPKERCKTTMNLVPGDEAQNTDSEVGETEELMAKKRCQKCDTAMESYLIDEGRKLHVCGNNPDCDGYLVEAGQFKIKGYDGPLLDCDKCGAEMQLKNGRFGKYFGCMSEDCKNTRKLLKSGQPAPPKADPIPMPDLKCQKVDDHYVLRDGASGIFLAASQFPKNRETRAPLVIELQPVKKQLDPKLAYLADAPKADPDGRPAVIRFSRKTKQQYVMSENDKDKPTGWVAFYENGKWSEDATKYKG